MNTAYQEYFRLFNEGRFFEAHEVLERIWLPERGTHVANYYKGLIQLAGAFVHVQKNRIAPALALLALAESNLLAYRPVCLGSNVDALLQLIELARESLREGNTDFKPVIRSFIEA